MLVSLPVAIIITAALIDLVLVVVLRKYVAFRLIPVSTAILLVAAGGAGPGWLFTSLVAAGAVVAAMALGPVTRSPLGFALSAGGLAVLILPVAVGWSFPVFRWLPAVVGLVACVVAAVRFSPSPISPLFVPAVFASLATAPVLGLAIGPNAGRSVVAFVLLGLLWLFLTALADGTRREVGSSTVEGFEAELAVQEDLTSAGLLAATVAHELKNRLANLVMAAQHGLRSNEVQAKDAALQTVLSVGRSEPSAVTTLLGELAARASEKPQSVPLSRLIQDAARVVRCSVPGTRIDINVNKSITLTCRRTEIRHVLVGLLRNAGRAYGNQPGRVRVIAKFRGGDVVVDVVDRAGGLSVEARLPALEQLNTAERGGLGLALASRVLRRNGGRLEYASQPHGSLFRVILPHRVDTAPPPLL